MFTWFRTLSCQSKSRLAEYEGNNNSSASISARGQIVIQNLKQLNFFCIVFEVRLKLKASIPNRYDNKWQFVLHFIG